MCEEQSAPVDYRHETRKLDVNLNSAIENTITVSRNEWRNVAELELDLDPDLPAVPCFESEFNQVILNLVINAVHAIGASRERQGGLGTITIRTRTAADDHVEVCVSDDGCGISDAVRDRIFDPFFTTKEIGKGTGQGLALARTAIVEQHGGAVEVESEEGVGTTIRIRLPYGDGATAAA